MTDLWLTHLTKTWHRREAFEEAHLAVRVPNAAH